ncbi:MAG: hypothetical protein GY799_32395 [Desulfobulbaceae bacterium]|nr:hypothetical protein [Desulfobulbaceae bacterium]
MKCFYLLLLGLLLTVFPVGLQAEDGATEMKRIGEEVAALKLGLGDYFIGQILDAEKREIAKKNVIHKTINGTYKFQDGDVFVVASKKTDMVIGIYKQNTEASRDDVKKMVGELMMQFEEPTTMAHDKLIYWAFGKDGRISEDLFDMARESGGEDVLATIKFSSSLPIAQDSAPEKGEKEEAVKDDEISSIYVMINSIPLSKVFLSLNKQTAG